MKIQKGSDLKLILDIEDIKGRPLRVEDTAHFKLYVWTANRNNYLTFNKRDILTKGNVDRIAIPDFYMNTLESGVLCYTYDYAMWDSAFNHTDCMYNKVKKVVTDIEWENCNFNEIPANPVNYQTLEYIRDLIEQEKLERERADKHFKHYLDCEYSNKLTEEVERSTAEDEALHTLIDSNKEATDASVQAVNDKLDAEIRRSTEVDLELHNLINANKTGTTTEIETATNNLNTALNNEVSRATTKENEIATNLTTELNRATAAEKQLRDTINAETDRAIERENAINSKVVEVIENLGDEIERSLEKDREHKQELDIESNRAKAEENRIDNALTVEVSRATAKENELAGTIQSEVERAKAVERDITSSLQTLKTAVAGKNTEATEAIEAESNRAKAKEAELNTAVADEIARAIAKEKVIEDALNAEIALSTNTDNQIKASVAGLTEANAELTSKVNEEIVRAVAKEAEIASNLSAEATRASAKEQEIADSVASLTSSVNTEISRSTAKDTELTKAVDDEVLRATAKENEIVASVSANANAVDAINQKIDIINGNDLGSINHAVEDSKHYTDDEIAKLKNEVGSNLNSSLTNYATKQEVDKRINDVIGTAPEALDTLGEIANVLNGNGDAIDAINGVLVGKADKADTYTKAEVDGKVATVASNLTTEQNRAVAVENKLQTDLGSEVNRAKAAEKANADAIAVIKGDKTVVGSINHAIEDAKHYTDDEVAKAVAASEVKYATKDEVGAIHIPTKVSELNNDVPYLTQHQDISHLASKADVSNAVAPYETIAGAASKYQPIGNYITQHQDISNLATKAEVKALGDKVDSAFRVDGETLVINI